jgi:shikimate kinase
MSLILCGLPSCGKSFFGKRAAENLQWTFIDVDRIIEKRYVEEGNNPLSCREIYKIDGSAAFRGYEKAVIVSLKDCKNSVIATGGGALNDEENIKHLKQIGKIVYLKLSIATLYDRLRKLSSFPAYIDLKDPYNSFEKIALQRMPIYEHSADVILDIDSIEEDQTISQICSVVRLK